MTSPKSPRNRPYQQHQQHGLYALQGALRTMGNQDGWVEALGPVGDELRVWQASIMADLGGEENISAMERSIVELATKTHLLLASVDRFLLEQPSLVNKSRRQLFPVVLQRQQLADALARYMGQLGLKRRAKPTSSIDDYLTTKYGKRAGASAEPDAEAPGGVATAQGAPGQETEPEGDT